MNRPAIHIHDELIEGCRKNHRKSQLQVYNLYYKAMYNTAYRFVKDSAEAEDIIQEAFITVFQKIEDFKGDATFGAWLKRIVINRAIDAIRMKKESVSLDESEAVLHVEVDDTTENYLETLSYKADQIRRGIERLGSDDRIIISLFLLEGYDHEEISTVLGISYNASRTRYSRARQKLREMLTNEKMNELVN